MYYSLGEIETMALRACHGAGFPWGLAVEAGAAVRRLHQRGLSALPLLLGRLRMADFVAQPQLVRGDIQRTEAGLWICPIVVGSYLHDRQTQLAAGKPFRFQAPVVYPLLLVPALAACARPLARGSIVLTSSRLKVVCGSDSWMISGDPQADSVGELSCLFSDKVPPTESPPPPHLQVDDTCWRELTGFAHRMFAPISVSSRLTGAGEQLVDSSP